MDRLLNVLKFVHKLRATKT